MARNGSGVYSLPAGLPTNGETSNATDDILTPFQDLETDMNTARPVVAGGTGATSASAARTNLGLAIGTDVQAYHANLASLAGLTFAADKGLYTTGANTAALYDLTTYGRTLAGLADAAALRSNINVEDGATADQTAAEIAAMSQDWRGEGAETLIEATTALQGTGGTDWEVVETITTTSGTTITVPSTGDLADGYEYALEFLEVQKAGGASTSLQVDVYGATAAAYTGSPLAASPSYATAGLFGWVEIGPVRTSKNAHMIPMGRLGVMATDASSDGSDAANGNTFSPIFHFATAQKINRLQFSDSGAGAFDTGAVKLWRKAI